MSHQFNTEVDTIEVDMAALEVLEIDGSKGEGGGQVLRTTMAWSMLLGKPIKISKIRAGRAKPGLAAQHLAGINLVHAIGGESIRGNYLGSTQIEFTPKDLSLPCSENWVADPKTAGSISLLIQIALPCLFLRDKADQMHKHNRKLDAMDMSRSKFKLNLSGGTNVSFSPPIEHVEHVLIPILNRMGINKSLDPLSSSDMLSCSIERYGYFPKGMGRVEVEISPVENMRPFNHSRSDDKDVGRGPYEIKIIFNSQCGACEVGQSDIIVYDNVEALCREALGGAIDGVPAGERLTSIKVIKASGARDKGEGGATIALKASDHGAKKRDHTGGRKPKERLFSLVLVLAYESGATLYQHTGDLSLNVDAWSSTTKEQVLQGIQEMHSMVLSGADLDERTADQVVLYEAFAHLNAQTTAHGEKRQPSISSFMVPPESKVSSAHLETVAHLTTLLTGVVCTIERQPDTGCRRICFMLV